LSLAVERNNAGLELIQFLLDEFQHGENWHRLTRTSQYSQHKKVARIVPD
jgi:hypothetical protein